MNPDFRITLPDNIQEEAKALFRIACTDGGEDANKKLWDLIDANVPEAIGHDWVIGYTADLTHLNLAPYLKAP